MLITNETEQQYHAHVDADGFPAIGSTKLKTFLYDSPKHFQEQHLLGLRESGNSEASRFGKHVHAYALEGRFDVTEQYIVYPPSLLKSDGAVNSRAADYQGWLGETLKQGKEPIKQKDLDILEKKVERFGKFLRNHEVFAALTSAGEPEVAFRRQRDDGITVQAKIDHLNPNGLSEPMRFVMGSKRYEYNLQEPYFFDLKVTELNMEDWDRKARRDMHYDSQAGHYSDILLKDTGERFRPIYGALHHEKNDLVDPRFQLYFFPRAVIDQAMAVNEDGLRRMAESKKTGIWPDGTGGFRTLDPSRKPGTIAEDLSI